MTVFLRLYLSTFTTDFDGGTEFLRWSLADEGDSAAAYTYEHLLQTLTEGLYSYAGLSQMKEIRLLPILINIYNRR